MKVAYKKGETIDQSNFWPLSMISVPRKILEGQICKHIANHMEEHKLQTDRQWDTVKIDRQRPYCYS